MGFAHIVIHMQAAEGGNFPADHVFANLGNTICDLRQNLKLLEIPTLHVALVPQLSLRSAIIGEFRAVNRLMNRNNLCLRVGKNIRFSIPVSPDDMVAAMTTYSACDNATVAYLKSVGADTVVLTGVWEKSLWTAHSDESYLQSCVTVSAKDFANAGFKVVVVSEGTNILPIDIFRKKELRWYNPVQQEERVKANLALGFQTQKVAEVLARATQAESKPNRMTRPIPRSAADHRACVRFDRLARRPAPQ